MTSLERLCSDVETVFTLWALIGAQRLEGNGLVVRLLHIEETARTVLHMMQVAWVKVARDREYVSEDEISMNGSRLGCVECDERRSCGNLSLCIVRRLEFE